MRIYTKAVWQWQPDGSLVSVPEECESFEYEGPVALCLGDDEKAHLNPLGPEAAQAKQPKQPTQPDYIGAANAQSYGSIQSALASNYMAHPDVYTPLGSQTWKQNGTNKVNIPGYGDIEIPNFASTINLAPDQQKLYDQQQQMYSGLQGQIGDNLSQPFNMGGVNDVADKAYGAITSRLDPQWKQNKEMQDSQLANQGITQGSEAYDNAMRTFHQGRNDAYTQAELSAIQTMPQTLQMETALRDQPINEMAALKGGTPVNMPQFQPTQYPGQAQGPNSLQAATAAGGWQQAMYNAQVQQANAQKSSMYGFGAAALGAFI